MPPEPAIERALHRTIRQVSEQLPEQQFNTAIAAMMEYMNVIRTGGRTPRIAELAPLVVMVAPFAPHIGEELYERLGFEGGLFASARWPAYDPAKVVDETLNIAVQVNGKLRGEVTVNAEAGEDSVREAAELDGNVARHLAGKRVRKVIYVPNKLINLVAA